MAEHFDGDEATANSFKRRYLHEWEARAVYETGYTAPLNLRCPAHGSSAPAGSRSRQSATALHEWRRSTNTTMAS
jgi:hypothetical protein